MNTTFFRLLALGLAVAGCQTKTPDQYFLMGPDVDRFRLGSQTTREVEIRIYPRIDLLWVVDNSGSMDNNQRRLASAFDEFSAKYLRDGRMDLRTAVITTDTYLPGTDNRPANYNLLSSGCHDGKRPPCSGSGARSGKPIISTRLPDGSIADPADATFFNSIVSSFKLNAMPGTNGFGNESATASIVSFLRANESASRCANRTEPYCFFRRDSVRVLIPFTDAVDSCAPSTSGPCFPQSSRATMFKDELDDFFMGIDGKKNYFMVAIRETEDDYNHSAQIAYDSVRTVLAGDSSNERAGLTKVVSINEPLNTVLEDLGETLGSIYETEISIVAEFKLRMIVNPSMPVRVYVIRGDGSVLDIKAEDYQITGDLLQIRPRALEGLSPNDELRVEYIRDVT